MAPVIPKLCIIVVHDLHGRDIANDPSLLTLITINIPHVSDANELF